MPLLALAVALAPAQAGGKGKDKQDGGINPSNIAVIEEDLTYTASVDSYDSTGETNLVSDTSWAVAPEPVAPENQMDVDDAHQAATGRGILVAVLDSGFNLDHPALLGHLAPFGYDAVDLDGDAHDPGNGIDDDGDGFVDGGLGHGTFVAGMVLRVAPDATIVPVRVRDDEGLGSNEELVRGIEYAIALGVDVINLSLSNASARQQGVVKALADARQSGLVVVVAAGNEGNNWLSKLCYGEDTIAVGAVDAWDTIAPFSNYDAAPQPALMIFAPGVDLYGPMGTPTDDAMGTWSGTSFAAGFVSGGAALLLERRPWYGPAEVKWALAEAVDPVWFATGEPCTFAGRIDLGELIDG